MIEITKWAGLVTNASPYVVPDGAMTEQVNLQIINPGQISVRPGLTAQTWSATDVSTKSVVTAFRYQRDVGEQIIYQDSEGKIYSTVKNGQA